MHFGASQGLYIAERLPEKSTENGCWEAQTELYEWNWLHYDYRSGTMKDLLVINELKHRPQSYQRGGQIKSD